MGSRRLIRSGMLGALLALLLSAALGLFSFPARAQMPDPSPALSGLWTLTEEPYAKGATVQVSASPGSIVVTFVSPSTCPYGDTRSTLFSGQLSGRDITGDQYTACSGMNRFNAACGLTAPYQAKFYATVSPDGTAISGEYISDGWGADEKNGQITNCHRDSRFDSRKGFLLTRSNPCNPAELQRLKDEYQRWLSVSQALDANAADLGDRAMEAADEGMAQLDDFFGSRLLDVLPNPVRIYFKPGSDVPVTVVDVAIDKWAEAAKNSGDVAGEALLEKVSWLPLLQEETVLISNQVYEIGEINDIAAGEQDALDKSLEALHQANAVRDLINEYVQRCGPDGSGLGGASSGMPVWNGKTVALGQQPTPPLAQIIARAQALQASLAQAKADVENAQALALDQTGGPLFSLSDLDQFVTAVVGGFNQLGAADTAWAEIRALLGGSGIPSD